PMLGTRCWGCWKGPVSHTSTSTRPGMGWRWPTPAGSSSTWPPRGRRCRAVLERLHVRNFAVARDLVVEFAPGLNVFTGETGAGKSLIVDALAFAFGARGGREVISPGAER